MPWSPLPIFDNILDGPGWSETVPASPPVSVPGWWVGLDLDVVMTVQFLSQTQLVAARRLDIVRAVSFNRDVVIKAIKPLAIAKNFDYTVDLRFQGIYMLNVATPISMNRVLSVLRVAPISLQRPITASMALSLSRIVPIDVVRPIGFSASVGLANFKTLDFQFPINFGVSLDQKLILPVNVAQTIGAAMTMAFGFRPLTTVTASYTTATYSWAFARNADWIDIVLLGDGGGGQGGQGTGSSGYGGQAGYWAAVTLRRGVDIPWDILAITGTIGQGGVGGAANPLINQNGTAGSGTTATFTGAGTLVAQGGEGGEGVFGTGSQNGEGVANYTFNGILYTGGAAKTSGSAGTGGGNPPGGGARGGNLGAFYVGQTAGGKGAPGRASFRAYQ